MRPLTPTAQPSPSSSYLSLSGKEGQVRTRRAGKTALTPPSPWAAFTVYCGGLHASCRAGANRINATTALMGVRRYLWLWYCVCTRTPAIRAAIHEPPTHRRAIHHSWWALSDSLDPPRPVKPVLAGLANQLPTTIHNIYAVPTAIYMQCECQNKSQHTSGMSNSYNLA